MICWRWQAGACDDSRASQHFWLSEFPIRPQWIKVLSSSAWKIDRRYSLKCRPDTMQSYRFQFLCMYTHITEQISKNGYDLVERRIKMINEVRPGCISMKMNFSEKGTETIFVLKDLIQWNWWNVRCQLMSRMRSKPETTAEQALRWNKAIRSAYNVYVTIDEILYWSADNSYTALFMHDRQKMAVSNSPWGRTHQSGLVNKYRIRSYKRG